MSNIDGNISEYLNLSKDKIVYAFFPDNKFENMGHKLPRYIQEQYKLNITQLKYEERIKFVREFAAKNYNELNFYRARVHTSRANSIFYTHQGQDGEEIQTDVRLLFSSGITGIREYKEIEHLPFTVFNQTSKYWWSAFFQEIMFITEADFFNFRGAKCIDCEIIIRGMKIRKNFQCYSCKTL